jgi:hypothetical protein
MGGAMNDSQVGALWRTVSQEQRASFYSQAVKELIRKLVEERARYHAAHYKPEALNEALKDFGIKPEDVS